MAGNFDKTSLLCYGRSGNGKSTQARYIAQWVWERYKKKTRFIALDRGSLWAPVADLVDQGIVIPLEFPTAFEYNPFSIMRKLRRGEFPQEGKINPPTLVKVGQETKYQTNTKWLPWTEKETQEIGAIVIDSLTSFATSYMSDAKQKNLRLTGDAGASPRTEDGETTGTNTMNHYGDAHTEVLDAINAFQVLPVHVTYFTALEDMGMDDSGGTKKVVLGPATVGKAIVSVIPQRVQNVFHLTSEGVGAKKRLKAWYGEHPGEIAALMWPAKVALLPHELGEFWKAYPEGFIPLTLDKGIGEFLEFRDKLRNGKGK